MYFPFMRGKRHELSALRKIAVRLSAKKFCSIIEPVKKNTSELLRTIIELNRQGHVPIIIINPLEGELSGDRNFIFAELQKQAVNFIPCVAFELENHEIAYQLALQLSKNDITIATYFKDEPIAPISGITSISSINFVRESNSSSYHFLSTMPRLVKIKYCMTPQERNADYPTQAYVFSDAHLTYNNLPNAVGFGDYQVVGEPFSDKGGPARAVALHITYFNSTHNDLMFIKHCVSTIDSNSTSNTAAKFIQALGELISFAAVNPDIDKSTLGFQEFLDLHRRAHYPNLGPAKESSLMHHIETIVKHI